MTGMSPGAPTARVPSPQEMTVLTQQIMQQVMAESAEDKLGWAIVYARALERNDFDRAVQLNRFGEVV